jgi:hypothetical protein
VRRWQRPWLRRGHQLQHWCARLIRCRTMIHHCL